METSSLSSLEGLTDIGLRGGIDMRPTLLRVLTDLYVQKLTHTPSEEHQYTELALRLLEAVDSSTRAAIAARLADHLSPPMRVIQRLAADLPEVAAAFRSPTRPAPQRAATELEARSSAAAAEQTSPQRIQAADSTAKIGADVASELNELFFAADASERRLILLNLDVVASLPATRSGIARDATIGRRLESAALARKRQDFTQVLAHSLSISRAQAHRIAADELGEPIVVAAKALGVPRDLLHRILLFVNTAVGHSVERVHALAELYDEISPQAAQDLIAVWQALNANEDDSAAGTHQLLLAHDEERAHPPLTAQRTPQAALRNERREAS